MASFVNGLYKYILKRLSNYTYGNYKNYGGFREIQQRGERYNLDKIVEKEKEREMKRFRRGLVSELAISI